MSVKFSTVYVVNPGDTLASIASAFRLSSYRALTGIPGNAHLGQPAPGGALDPGTKVRVPPNACDLLRERKYALHSVRPMLDAHFNDQQALVEEEVLGPVLMHRVPTEPEDVDRVLSGLRGLVADAIATVSRASAALAQIGLGMSETHVATANDHAVAGSSVGDLTGLYWMLSGNYVAAWSDMWDTSLWVGKWAGKDSASARTAVTQHINTVRSIVVQQADARLRETLALERSLQFER